MLVGNPPLLEEVLTESRARGRSPGRLRFVLSGGGPVPPTLKMAWRDELKIPLVESYGQSELGGFVALGFPELEPDDDKLMRIGPPLPDKEVRVFGAGRPGARRRRGRRHRAARRLHGRAIGAARRRPRRRRAAAGCAPAISACSMPTATSPCAAGAPS